MSLSAAPRGFARTIAFKAAAEILSKTVTLIVTVAAARLLPAADFGVLAIAMTTGWILSVASDAGLPLFLAKRMAGLTGAARPISFAAITSVMRVRMGLGVAAVAAGLMIGSMLVPTPLLAAFVLIVNAQLLNAVVETLSHAHRGLGRTNIESGLVVAQRGVTGIVALAVLVVAVAAVARARLAIPPALPCSRRCGLREVVSADATGSAEISLSPGRFMREAAPIGVGILLSRWSISAATSISCSSGPVSRPSASTTPPFASSKRCGCFRRPSWRSRFRRCATRATGVRSND